MRRTPAINSGVPFFLLTQLFAAQRGDRVVTRTLIVRRLPPLGPDPALLPHALQRRVQRTFLNADDFL